MLLSLICLPVRNNLFAGQMWLTRVKTSNFRCNFHEVLGISKVSCPRKKKEKKSIGRRRRRRWYSHGACPRNVVGVVKVPIRIRVIFPSLSFSFFSFACFAIFERARCLARIQCCYRLINHVIYQRWPTRILPIEYAAFSRSNAFVCDTFLTNLSPFFLISCTKLLSILSFKLPFKFPCLLFYC